MCGAGGAVRVASGHEEPSLGQQSHDVAGCVVRRQMLAEPVQWSGVESVKS